MRFSALVGSKNFRWGYVTGSGSTFSGEAAENLTKKVNRLNTAIATNLELYQQLNNRRPFVVAFCCHATTCPTQSLTGL